MITTTTNEIPNQEIVEILGIVKGATIRAKHLGKDIVAGFRHLIGGEVKEYTEMIREARNIAFNMMIKEAEELQADAIVGIRFSTTSVMQGAAEILVYGTAVKLKNG